MWLTGFDAPSPAHDVRRQADARPRAHAGDRAREPRVSRQARRAGGRLPRARARAEAGARDLHGERRHRRNRASIRTRRWRSCWRNTRSAAASSTASTGRRGQSGTAARAAGAAAGGAGAHPGAGGRQGPAAATRCAICRRPSRSPCRTRRRCAFATTSPSSRRCARCSPSTRRVNARLEEELDLAVRQIVSRAVASEGVVDIFAAAGLQEAGHLDPLGRVPGRGARHAAAESRGGIAAESCSRARSRRGAERTSSRRSPSPRCSSSRSASTRTAPSRRRR